MEAVGDTDEELVYAWTQFAMESALRNDPSAGVKYLRMAMGLRDRTLEAKKVELKREAQEMAEQQLGLMREKFEAQQATVERAQAEVSRQAEKGGLSAEALEAIESAFRAHG